MIIAVGVGCFILGVVAGAATMGLCAVRRREDRDD